MRRRLHDGLLATWYGEGGSGRWLLPAAWLFGGLVRLRRVLYRAGVLGRYRSPRAVVVVGNLTVGGTGKTPLVTWLARELARRGLRPGIALRGYGGGAGAARRVADDDTAAEAGDEAVMLRRRLGLPVAIGARRSEAVRLLEPDCDVVVCDDGLQHYALARDVEVAVVDGVRGLGNGRLLPAGPLRERPGRLDEVDAVVVNGDGWDRAGALRMRLAPVEAVALAGGARRPLADFAGRPALAVAAIGHPERFFALLRAHGIAAEGHAFPDHATIDPGAVGDRRGRPVLMTEKDAVKCEAGAWDDAWYVVVEAQVEGAALAPLLDRIEAAARRREARDD